MRKSIRIVLVIVFGAFLGFNIYSEQKIEILSDYALNNVEALAQPEWQKGDCYGCYFSSYYICLTLGDWGWCLGEWYGDVHPC